MRLEDLMERAAQYDENLARDIKLSCASDLGICLSGAGGLYLYRPSIQHRRNGLEIQ